MALLSVGLHGWLVLFRKLLGQGLQLREVIKRS